MLQRYLIRVYTSGGYLDQEYVEYGLDQDHARKRAAEKFHRHISYIRCEGEIK